MIYYKKRPKTENLNIDFDIFPESLQFIHISDTHFGKFSDKFLIESILEAILNNSFIIFNGDIFDSIASEDVILKYLDMIFDIIGEKTIIYIYGNHEVDLKNREVFENKMAEAPKNFIILKDEIIYDFQKLGFNILGLMNYQYYSNMSQDEVCSNQLIKINNNLPTLILSHNSRINSSCIKSNLKILILSGHTHGGQIIYFGKRILKDFDFISGIKKYNENLVSFVSNGAGYGRIPLRIGIQNKIDNITFLKKK